MERSTRLFSSTKLFKLAIPTTRKSFQTARWASTGAGADGKATKDSNASEGEKKQQEIQKRKKTMAELDAELLEKLEAQSGDGGASGIEYEDGKPAAMKRGVRDNMFRYI